MPKYQILYWHDIPVQVRISDRRNRLSKPLPPRFQEAVDKAAMRSGHRDDEAYTAGFHWGEAVERSGTPEEVIESVVTELDALYPEIDWRQTAARLKARDA